MSNIVTLFATSFGPVLTGGGGANLRCVGFWSSRGVMEKVVGSLTCEVGGDLWGSVGGAPGSVVDTRGAFTSTDVIFFSVHTYTQR